MFIFIILIMAIIFSIFPFFSGKYSKEVASGLSGLLAILILIYSIITFRSYSGGFVSKITPLAISTKMGLSFTTGVDGFTDALLILSAIVMLVSILITKREYGSSFYGLAMVVEAGLIGLLISRDFLFFYIFWEVILIPIFFMIGRYGSGNKDSISLKFFVYTHIGSVFILLSIFSLYSEYIIMNPNILPTFQISRLMDTVGSLPIFWKGFILFGFLVGFLVKLPSFPIHSWLPDSYYSAPYPTTVILAGALSMMGGYGLFGILLPEASFINIYALYLLAALGIISIVYFALTAMFQRNIKKMMAFASASAMGFVTLAFAASAFEAPGNIYSSRIIEVSGGMFQIIAHGLIMTLVFAALFYIRESTKTDDVYGLGGIYREAPKVSAFLLIGLLASLGLPGFAGFIGEFSIVVGVFQAISWYIFILIFGMIITASYHIWTAQRSLYGPYNEKLGFIRDVKPSEFLVLIFLVLIIFILGVFPNLLYFNITTYAKFALYGVML
ncbi:MAG: NADH-quinone oxidoreductase subunit M [Thermoplasmata archaeon]